MMLIKKVFLIFNLLFISILCNALEVVECEDENGERAFFKHCPPNMTEVNKKNLNVEKAQTTQVKVKAIHYYTDNCGACDQVSDFFKLRKIEVTGKDVNDNIELQQELQALVNELRVPTVIIGDEVIQGYNRDKLLDALNKTGWKEAIE